MSEANLHAIAALKRTIALMEAVEPTGTPDGIIYTAFLAMGMENFYRETLTHLVALNVLKRTNVNLTICRGDDYEKALSGFRKAVKILEEK